MMKKQTIALVLSGGGARGITHIGVIEELLARGYHITSIAGTSMGSIIGGAYAMGKLEIFKEFLLSLDKKTAFQLLDFSVGGTGLIKGEKLMTALENLLGKINIEELDIPYVAIATDVSNKVEVEFKSGNLYSAIRASIAIPSVFTPVKTKDGLLVDGGVINNIPIHNIERKDGDRVIAVNVNANVPITSVVIGSSQQAEVEKTHNNKLINFQEYFHKFSPINLIDKMGYARLIEQTISLMTNTITGLSLERDKPDLLINISKDTCNVFDFFKPKELISIGKATTAKHLDEWEANTEQLQIASSKLIKQRAHS